MDAVSFPLRKRLWSRLFLSLLGLCFVTSSHGDTLSETGKIYVELGPALGSVRIDNTDFDFAAAELRMGGYVYTNIGIELHLATGLSDDKQDDLELSMDYSANLLARFETPEREGFKLMLLAGYGQTSLDLDRSGTGSPGSETFKNANFGLGANYRWKEDSPFSAGLKWHRYYAEGDITIDLTSLTFNMDF